MNIYGVLGVRVGILYLDGVLGGKNNPSAAGAQVTKGMEKKRQKFQLPEVFWPSVTFYCVNIIFFSYQVFIFDFVAFGIIL